MEEVIGDTRAYTLAACGHLITDTSYTGTRNVSLRAQSVETTHTHTHARQ